MDRLRHQVFARAHLATQVRRRIEISGSFEQLEDFYHRIRGSYDGALLMNFLDLSIERGLSAEHGSSVSDAIEGQDHIRCLEGPSEAIESTPLARFLSEKVTRSCPGQNDDSLRESVGDPENNVSAGSAIVIVCIVFNKALRTWSSFCCYLQAVGNVKVCLCSYLLWFVNLVFILAAIYYGL